MKIVANPEIGKTHKSKVPCIMQWTGDYDKGLIVLFVSDTSGIVLVSGKHEQRTGAYVKNWNSSGWAPYKGSITISND